MSWFGLFPLSLLVCGLVLRAPASHSRHANLLQTLLGALALAALVLAGARLSASIELAASPLQHTLLILVLTLGFILARFSRNYLQGETNAPQFSQWFALTLAAVTTVILSDNIFVLWIGWVAISLSFHQLLLFYPNRPRAQLAAHKKFLFARLSEVLLLAALLMLWSQHDATSIRQIMAHYTQLPADQALTLSEHLIALLLVLTALIKCAQMPLHGWLIQVVEAPTPVSALLHAGIVNLGGFLVMTFGSLILASYPARWLLLLVAGITLMLASLVMLTRVSIKVKLAWSTAAQMGLMLVECALGLFQLALLHLILHSLYKAYAFLNSGNQVQGAYLKALLPAAILPTQRIFTLCMALVLVLFFLSGWLHSQSAQAPLMLIALGLIGLPLGSAANPAHVVWIRQLSVVIIAWAAYLGFSKLFAQLIAMPPYLVANAFGAMDSVFFVLLIATYTLQSYLHRVRYSANARSLHQLLFAGLYLDEWSTRLTLKLWPIRLANNSRANKSSTAYNWEKQL
ncbi:NADH-quinone oxidoreductase subunit L [Bowmanella sp. JS7-9]|uniref:Probable inorganic carbon transporter subunit DabB n=1 Tax=Pseudobowmanella zhangzhouensis TaxID=1537679 RepID=A0ABW1XNE7_9ALTE|nr:NADH-quinone oxidoreductase subunit L [Bowmanella sp. JS7-9]